MQEEEDDHDCNEAMWAMSFAMPDDDASDGDGDGDGAKKATTCCC